MGETINLVNNFKVEKIIFNCGLEMLMNLEWQCIDQNYSSDKVVEMMKTECLQKGKSR